MHKLRERHRRLTHGSHGLYVGPGDAIFTTPFTFISTAEVISLVGATPVFVDINPETFNIDPEKLKEAIAATQKESKLKLRGVIPVDLFGQPADYDTIETVAKEFDLFVLEDAAQSFGASYNGKKACGFGDIAATSFFPAKPLGCYGDGGAVLPITRSWPKSSVRFEFTAKAIANMIM